MASITVHFSPARRKATVRQGTNILNAAIGADVPIRAECGGNGVCGKCRIVVRDQTVVDKLTENEKKHLSSNELTSGYRLACQTVPTRNVKVVIPKESRIAERRILSHGVEKRAVLEPLVSKFHLKLKEPSLSDITPDFERLLQALPRVPRVGELTIDHAILKKLPDTLRQAGWNVTVTIWADQRIISVEAGDTTHSLFGFAVDIGTSKVVGHLVDLTTGKTVATHSIENPQLVYGADIITRVAFAMENETNLQILQRLVLEGINKVLERVCAKAKIASDQVYETVLVGNTAMHHLVLGIQPRYTALSPYVPAMRRSIKLPAKELGLKAAPDGLAGFLPNIAGFVGGDAIGDIVATRFNLRKKQSMLVDMGTNTEVFVGNFRDILACSCAAGPAFEGARIKHGMKAETGAIERVHIGPDSEVEYTTIDDVKPIGLCGSAMIDVVAEMFKAEIIDSRGAFNSNLKTPRMKRTGNQTEFVVAYPRETSSKHEIVVTQRDVGEIQLAKAAIFTGCSLLMRTRNLERQDLDKVFVAGAFGNYLNTENAKFLGLLPDLAKEKMEFVGNTAVVGAKMALTSKETRKTAEKLSRSVRYLELGTVPEFNKELAEAMFIPHRDLERFPSVRKYLVDVGRM